MSPTNEPGLEPGTPVRFTAGNLGALADPNAGHFVASVHAGDEGIVEGPHPALPAWIIVRVDAEQFLDGQGIEALEEAGGGRYVYVPVHPSHVEVIR